MSLLSDGSLGPTPVGEKGTADLQSRSPRFCPRDSEQQPGSARGNELWFWPFAAVITFGGEVGLAQDHELPLFSQHSG